MGDPRTRVGGEGLFPLVDPAQSLLETARTWHRWLDLPKPILEAMTPDDLVAEIESRWPMEDPDPVVRLRGHRAMEGRIWWDCGKQVHRMDIGTVRAVVAEARRVMGSPWLEHIAGLRMAKARGTTWAAYFEIADSSADPLALLGGAILFDGAEAWLEADIRIVAEDGAPNILTFSCRLEETAGRVVLPTAVVELVESSPARKETLMRELAMAAWWLCAMAWAVESPVTRSARVTGVKPKGKESRRRLRLRRDAEARGAQVRRVKLVPNPDGGLSREKPATSSPAALLAEGAGSPRIAWSPPHVGVRWVHEDNVREDDELVGLREDEGRTYYACLRPIRGWGEVPEGAKKKVYFLGAAIEE